jgi:pimeloyl-ACP methyl ester carboxylesterase
LKAELSPSEARREPVKSVKTDALWIVYVEHGPIKGWPVILSHGFPTTSMLSMKWLQS